ncbi:antibiotic biosynthesis monooxygenase [Bacillus glycinifermentans]|uniref:antibiotic biosynthesis monooxygenase n=1 Tax=Bacillus glycinifermentans TaxID=1664069 RepID=UPI00398B29BB
MISKTPEPPYDAVIFASVKADGDDGCRETAPEDAEARRKAVRNEHGNGITVSYWESLEAIEKRKHHGERRQAKERGRNEWYADFAVRVTKVEAARFLKRTDQSPADYASGEESR